MSDQTHYAGCWEDPRHHACALQEIENLRTQRDAYANEITGALLPANERLRAEIERLRAALDAIVRKPGAVNRLGYDLKQIARETLGDIP